MGVPKFFRYISERYPCLSEYVKEYQIPVFDNLYLDMNGIIHMCSHPDDNDPHFRITEEKLFSDIFHYIEFLFRLIKPLKLFFMAIDGVAPRAKMNQQRGRRFRSAKDADKRELQALKKGEKLPEAARFDSNCITPSTEFMARLHEQLKYFVVKKVSTDKTWKQCKIILSGHETPGEGEHKIMDFIRYSRSQPGYDPNTRHCLYGLDADLIMLGLCTHDPHFSLLREEVKFGRKSAKRNNVPEDIHFYLLHLSLMREYLELEFGALKSKLAENGQFSYDLEKIIDDWILMGFLVGNDFIPPLPDIHIAGGALPLIYEVYKEILPTLDGYINEGGTLNLTRFEKFMKRLGEMDFKNFEEKRDDLLYMEAKMGRKFDEKPELKSTDPGLAALINRTDEIDVDSSEEEEIDPDMDDDELAFKNFKDEYYRTKLDFGKVTKDVMREQAEGYVRAVQWNLNYYYNGVSSWSWYYPHHYSPYISDIQGFSDLKIDFELGVPFKPYEQLLAVLPPASKTLLPEAYRNLMIDSNSAIKEYYPEDFQTDLNGKRQEWEAVVLVPFIDETKLLDAMSTCNENLTAAEKERNKCGPMLEYTYTEDDLGVYNAPNYFTPVRNHAKCLAIHIEDIRVPREKLVKGAYPGAKFDVFYPGFPTMKHLEYEGAIVAGRVRIFEQPSRNESMMLKVKTQPKQYLDDMLPDELLGQTVWVGWPHLHEAKVVAISNSKQRVSLAKNEKDRPYVESNDIESRFLKEVEGIKEFHKERMCIDFGQIKITVHVKLVSGRKYVFAADGNVNCEKQFQSVAVHYPLQGIVTDIKVHEEQVKIYKDVNDFYPVGSACFSLALVAYGAQGTIIEPANSKGELKVALQTYEEPDFSSVREQDAKLRNMYMTSSLCASYLQISNFLLSRLVGSLFITTRIDAETTKSANIGLDLRHNKRNLETPGYTRKIDNTWYYSDKTKDLVRQYNEKFPEIFHYVSRKNSGDELIADEIYPEDASEHIANIQNWLKSLPIHNLERRVTGSTVLETDLVKQLEEIIDNFEATPKELKLTVGPHLLYKAGLQTGQLVPDEKTQTFVFDRIVNVQENSLLPLGLKGTVVAIHKPSNTRDTQEDLYDIVFDQQFPGGISILNCTEGRGSRLYRTSFLNLTYGKREVEKRVGVPGAYLARAKEFAKQRAFLDSFKVHNTNPYRPDMMDQPQTSAFASFNNTTNAAPYSNPNRANNSPFRQQQQRNNQAPPLFPNPPQASPSPSGFNQSWRRQSENSSSNYSPRETRVYVPTSVKEKRKQQVQSAPAPEVQQSFHDFINFGNARQNSVDENQRPTVMQREPRKLEVDTELLKRMLNISGSSQEQRPKAQQSPQQIPQQSAKPKPTVDLLNYYQSNYLGCPRYSFCKNGNLYSAQVTLPNGQPVVGKEAPTKEEASELVAAQALVIVRASSARFMPEFPEPPRQWVQPQQQQPQRQQQQQQQRQHPQQQQKNQSQPQNSSRNINNNNHGTQRNQRKQQMAPRFVPLQAIKNKRTSTTTQNHTNNAEPHESKSKPLREGGQNVPQTSTTNDKEKKQSPASNQKRRPRIAANFGRPN